MEPALRGSLFVGLTGGIGAGKNVVADRLRHLGAVVIDSDDIAREVVAVGTDGLAEVIARFGSSVLQPDGAVDRAALAQIVFADAQARVDLERIVHPRVRAEVRRRAAAASGDIVVNAVPLLVEAGLAGDYDRVIVVEAPLELRLRRLTSRRGMTEQQARARIKDQADDAARRAVAWRVLVNDSSVAQLHRAVDAVWAELHALATAPGNT